MDTQEHDDKLAEIDRAQADLEKNIGLLKDEVEHAAKRAKHLVLAVAGGIAALFIARGIYRHFR